MIKFLIQNIWYVVRKYASLFPFDVNFPMSIFSGQATVPKLVSTCPRLNFVQSISSCLTALTNLISTCPGLNLAHHW